MGSKERLEQCKKDIVALEENKRKLEQDLENKSKPKLRHGDYAIDGNTPWLLIGGKFYWATSDEKGKLSTLNESYFEGDQILGNIFDDLEKKCNR